MLRARAPVAVIFRRGPSKLVEVIRWDLERDVFERGHWFRGRIYEKRSDLSPDGELLVYFATKYTGRTTKDTEFTYAWTAVSRAPWLTALALWPKGDAWWGGGLFTENRSLWLNHRPEEATPHPEHEPRGLIVEANPGAHGENEPIYRRRLERDGWAVRQEWTRESLGVNGWRTTVPEERVKPGPGDAVFLRIVIERRVDRFSYRERFRIEGAEREPEMPPGPIDWLDWDARGRLLALSGGRVWVSSVVERRVERFRELIDLRADAFEEREAPEAARRW
jgi:hypothetical protein